MRLKSTSPHPQSAMLRYAMRLYKLSKIQAQTSHSHHTPSLSSIILSTVTPTPGRPLLFLLNIQHIRTRHELELPILQLRPQLLIPGIGQLSGLQLGFIPYPGIRTRVEQQVCQILMLLPIFFRTAVDKAYSFMKRGVPLHAVDGVDFQPFLVKEVVEDLACAVYDRRIFCQLMYLSRVSELVAYLPSSLLTEIIRQLQGLLLV